MGDSVKVIDLGFVNAYLIMGNSGCVLVDTGMAYQWEHLEKGLVDAGCEGAKLKLVVITHGDLDHTGNAPKLREKYGVKIAIHGGDAPQVENGLFLKRTVRPFIYKLMFVFRMMMRKLKGVKMGGPKFKPDVLLSDGQSLAEYGVSAKVVHIPGHTPGSIGILTDTNDLIAGDMFVNRKKPSEAQIIENLAQLNQSYDKIKSMNVNMVYPGHGKPFSMKELLQGK